MHFTKSAASAVLLSSLALAKPVVLDERAVEDSEANLKFTVNQVVDPKGSSLSPQQQMLRTYRKYGKEPPLKVLVAAKVAQKFPQTGSVVTTPQSYDLAYLSPVTVGNQTFNLNFDTGSADLWLFSTQQPAAQTQGRNVYDPTKSKNATLMKNQAWAITYGDGSGASGKVYADSVVIGAVTATSQAVEAATSVSQQFLQDAQSGGLVGLGFSALNTVRPNQQTTFFDTVKNSLASKVFTANLKKAAPGSYDFGYVDRSKYIGAITYAPIQAETGFWQFGMGGYQIGGQARNMQSMGNGIADTGTTLLYLPDNVVSAYWASVSGSSYNSNFGAYIFPCAANLPTFSISIQGVLFTIPGNYMNYAPISNTMCFGGLQSNAGIGFSILGDVFLKSVFVIFDQSKLSPRIGFAKQSDGSQLGEDPDASSTTTTTTTTSSTTTTSTPFSTSNLALPTVSSLLSVVPSSLIASDARPLTITTSISRTTTSTRATTTTYDFTTLQSSFTLISSVTVAPLAASLPLELSSLFTTSPTTLTTKSFIVSAAELSTTSPSKPNSQASVKTTTKSTTTTTTARKTTTKAPMRKVTTTARKASKVVCNSKYIAAIKKAHPRHPKYFCRNYKPSAGSTRSTIAGIPDAATLKRVCNCMLEKM